MARQKQNTHIPSYDELILPTLNALIALGGSGSLEEINSKVYEITKLSDEILKIQHGEEGGQTEVDYRLAWSRTYLKKYGLIENSARRIWVLVNSNINTSDYTGSGIVKKVKEINKLSLTQTETKSNNDIQIELEYEEVEKEEHWKETLINRLYDISPSAFERLSQRLLRESGFSQVEVTGKVGDGGIDGKGIVRVSGLLSFHVIFQCKRYKGSVSPSQVRDFRGAMQGRADKGLIITTGTFTREAIKEATRDGAPPIDLIDGEFLCDKLKELKLGVETKQIEVVEIKNEWFANL